MAGVIPFQDLKERLLGMTGYFETSSGYPDGYGVTSGNHDGAGLSFGILQFNLGTGSLQPIWSYLDTNHNQLCRDIMGVDYEEWKAVITMPREQAILWGDSISAPIGNEPKRGVVKIWYDRFFALGTSAAGITKQAESANAWMPNALKWFNTLDLYSRRGLALCWDFSVQMGRLFPLNLIWEDYKTMDTAGKTKEEIEYKKMFIIVNRGSYHNRPNQFNQIVYDRKLMLINGTGHNGYFNMDTYELGYEPALAENAIGGLTIG